MTDEKRTCDDCGKGFVDEEELYILVKAVYDAENDDTETIADEETLCEKCEDKKSNLQKKCRHDLAKETVMKYLPNQFLIKEAFDQQILRERYKCKLCPFDLYFYTSLEALEHLKTNHPDYKTSDLLTGKKGTGLVPELLDKIRPSAENPEKTTNKQHTTKEE